MDNDFIQTMEGLVSNDKTIRESSLSKTHSMIISLSSNHEDHYKKIWKSLFYFFWNADKPDYQLAMSKKIAGFIYKEINNSSSDFIDYSNKWINAFINEFMKKFSSIDFLRLDKYIMLTDQIISVYLQACLTKKKYSSINMVIQQLTNEIVNHNYNYSFEANVLNTIGRFIDYVFKEKNAFVKSNWVKFFDCVLDWFVVVKDKRELKTFDDLIFGSIKRNIHRCNVASESRDRAKEVTKRKGEGMISEKRMMIDNLVKKIEDEKYEPKIKKEEGVVDPVNDYIMRKNYTCKFRKSPIEKMKEIIKKDKEMKKKKEQVNEMREKEKSDLKMNKRKLSEEQIEMEDLETNNQKETIKEEILEDNIITITDNDIRESNSDISQSKAANRPQDNDNDNDEDNELIENDDDDDEDNELLEDDNKPKEEIEGDEVLSDEDDDDYELEEYDDEEYEEIEDDEGDNEDVPELIEYYDEEDAFPMKEEDKNIQKAYHNSIKNMQILRQSNKQNQLLAKKTYRSNIQNFIKEKQCQSTPKKKTIKNKKVKYALENNTTSIYDHKKPILLQSQKKTVFSTEATQKKSLLKNKK